MKHIFFKRRILAVVALLFLLPNLLFADEFQIADIRIDGLQRVSASPVFAALPVREGDWATPEIVRTVIRSLFATGFFSDIKVVRDGSVLIVMVKERPAIGEIAIDGNKAIKTEQLMEVMEDNGLSEGQILQRETLDGIVKELQRQYIAQGRYSAEVELDVEELANNQVKVDIQIDEGKVASIRHINIVGNKVFDEKTLLDLFEINKTNWLSWIRGDDKYSKEKLKGDLETLESYYLDRGYLDFKIVSSQVSLSPDKRSVFITFNIHEGDIYTVSEIDLAGELILPEYSIRRLVLLRKGDTFSQNLMTTTSEYVTTMLGNAGYTNAKVEGIPEPDHENKTVKITFFVDPSSRVYVRRIEFRGNTRSTDEVLRREMRQSEGSPASNARIERGKVRLERLGYFKEVSVEQKEVPGSSDLVDVEYTVEEQTSGSVNASIGYSQGLGPLIGASLHENNWLGTGKQVGISINYSDYQTAYRFSYDDPYFTPDGVSRGINLYFQERDYSEFGGVVDYSLDNFGFGMSFGYPTSENQRLRFGFDLSHIAIDTGIFSPNEIKSDFIQLDLDSGFPYQQMSIEQSILLDSLIIDGNFDIDGDGLVEDFSVQTQPVTEDTLLENIEPGFIDLYGDSFNSVSLSFNWLRNTLNRGILATRGSMQRVSFEATLPKSDLEYYKIHYDAQYFLPLTRELTLRFKANLGFGDGYGDLDRLPFFEHYYGGGLGTLRGFRRNTLGPRSSPQFAYSRAAFTDFTAQDPNGGNAIGELSGTAYVDCGENDFINPNTGDICTSGKLMHRRYNSSTFRSFGGNTSMFFSTELIFPVPFIEDQRSVQLSLFVDAGNVFDTRCGEYQVNCSAPRLENFNASYGINLNWISGMGPLTFSFAKPFRRQDFDRRELFQFSMGTNF